MSLTNLISFWQRLLFPVCYLLNPHLRLSKLQGFLRDWINFRTTVRFLSVPPVYGSLQGPLPEFFHLEIDFLFKPKNLEHACAWV